MDNQKRIAVVGGGLSGLVVAEGLQRKGYKQVTVFEKADRVGGKLETIWYRGKSYEMGALFGLPDQKHLKKLMKLLAIKTDGPKVARVNYDKNGNRIMQIPKEALGLFVEELDRLPDVLARYQSLEHAGIVDLEPDLTLPFSDWCRMHDFQILNTVYAHYFTSYGLGNVEEMPTVYVLRILNYGNLMSFMDFPKFSTWKSGVSILIEGLQERIEDLRLAQGVKRIGVTANGRLEVETELETEEFERVVIASPLDQFADLYADDEEMSRYLGQIRTHRYNVFAFRIKTPLEGSGCILENLAMERRGHAVIWYSRWDSSGEEPLLMVYAYDAPNSKTEETLKQVKADLLQMGIPDPQLYQFRRWNQCPHVEGDVLRSGFYQKMAAMQGWKGIYLAGEIMSTVSMDNCIWHSQDLVDRYF